jgi:hypothetical protein
MRNWKAEAVERINQLVENGEEHAEAVRRVTLEYSGAILSDAEASLNNLFVQKQKKIWAEPTGMDQLRFDYGGQEFSTSDAPVRFTDDDGKERFKPARFSTAAERSDSLEARTQHHLSWVRRSEAEHARENKQNALFISMGFDISKPWDEMRHRDTTCWRCGLGWRAGDPFEKGHSDRPQSQGGVEVDWEHQSCNRSAQDNPVSPIENLGDDAEAAA